MATYQIIELDARSNRIETDEAELTEAQLNNILVELTETVDLRGDRVYVNEEGRFFSYICIEE